MKLTRFVLAFLFLSLKLYAQTNSAVPIPPHTYALIIGISKYEAANNIPPLRYADKDAEAFSDYLQSKAGGQVPAENIRLLTNEKADLASIFESFQWLRETAAANDLVYIYYAGHGDKTKDVVSLGYLLAYNSPLNNYPFQTIRIEDVNNTAATLSAGKNCNVVLITDACHSGDLTSKYFRGTMLVGDALRKSISNEIRITSCDKNQLSAENEAWGGGHGVFTYYLVNGLTGGADKLKKGFVTVRDIQQYLDSSFASDATLQENRLKQNPVIAGRPDFTLAKPETTFPVLQVSSPAPATAVNLLAPLPVTPAESAMRLLQAANLENAFDFKELDSLPPAEISLALLDQLIHRQKGSGNNADTLSQYREQLAANPQRLHSFSQKIVQLLHNRGQRIINLYLNGDEAELERRRYYNSRSSNYDVYPHLFSVARKLCTDPEFQKVLDMDRHYFTGVALRLKLVLPNQPASLADEAIAEELKALAFDNHAAYVYNELGSLYWYKNNLKLAEDNYLKAVENAPQWAIPWANLCGLYAHAKKYGAAMAAGRMADSLQADLHSTVTQLGMAYEGQNDLLTAEEYYRHAISLNQRHYLPFERLGYVYTRTTDYAVADSFFFEADLRKRGYNFNENGFTNRAVLAPAMPESIMLCPFDSTILLKDDIMGLFYWAMTEYYQRRPQNAERIMLRVANIDTANPLAFHYLGKMAFDKKDWAKAERLFRLSLQKAKDTGAFRQYCEDILRNKQFPYAHDCFERFFRDQYFAPADDKYFLAGIYEQWGHITEEEAVYRELVARFPGSLITYIKLWKLLESLDRYEEAEKLIEQYYFKNPPYLNAKTELVAFYKRAIDHFPENPEWSLKLGNLFYNMAEAPARDAYLDTVVYFPLIRKEVFINLELHRSIAEKDSFAVDNQKEIVGLLRNEVTNQLILNTTWPEINSYPLPGTKEFVELAPGPLLTPRYDAIQYFSKALEQIQEVNMAADINYKIGNVYVWAGSKRQAISYYTNAVEQTPDNATFRMRAVDINRDLFKNSQALKDLEYLQEHHQINYTHSLTLAKMYAWKGMDGQARKIFGAASLIQPYSQTSLLEENALIALLGNNDKQALALYKALLEENPNNAFAAYSLCRLYSRMKNKSEAEKWLQKSIRSGFNYKYILQYDPDIEFLRKQSSWKKNMALLTSPRTYTDYHKE